MNAPYSQYTRNEMKKNRPKSQKVPKNEVTPDTHTQPDCSPAPTYGEMIPSSNCYSSQNVVYPKSPTVQQSTANIVVHELEGSWKIGKITEKCSCNLIEEMTILHRSEMQFNLLLTFVFSFCLGIYKYKYRYDKYFLR